jgi:hypothetical protein
MLVCNEPSDRPAAIIAALERVDQAERIARRRRRQLEGDPAPVDRLNRAVAADDGGSVQRAGTVGNNARRGKSTVREGLTTRRVLERVEGGFRVALARRG